jgi:hypothetical protein
MGLGLRDGSFWRAFSGVHRGHVRHRHCEGVLDLNYLIPRMEPTSVVLCWHGTDYTLRYIKLMEELNQAHSTISA